MTKETILKAVRVCAGKLGRNPNLRELRLIAGVQEKAVYRRVGGLRKAFELAGLPATGPGFKPAERALLLDWARVAHKLKKLPTVLEYQRVGRYSIKPFHTRYGHWSRVAEAFRRFAGAAQNRGLRRQWRDVLEMIASTATASGHGKKARAGDPGATMHFRAGGVMPDRPVYGRPLGWPELAHAPVNELGVVYAFGAMARRLGFIVYRIQPGFPDCEALREVAPGQWQWVRIEFEFESRNFLKHRHRHDRCDIIVCWKHNWKDCPLEVVELGKEMEGLLAIGNW